MVEVHRVSLTVGSNRSIRLLKEMETDYGKVKRRKTCWIKAVSYADKVLGNNLERIDDRMWLCARWGGQESVVSFPGVKLMCIWRDWRGEFMIPVSIVGTVSGQAAQAQNSFLALSGREREQLMLCGPFLIQAVWIVSNSLHKHPLKLGNVLLALFSQLNKPRHKIVELLQVNWTPICNI